ncbi:hypothetical protein [Methylopila sp. M107]|uniref:phage late control D family protein n=1 Tax=Methylopila sp. M107 TaxID=1101190 RepID=UPI00035D9B23|nr:hypothetical protein [Methylopila sp. M107]
MNLLSALLEPSFREPASCSIRVGAGLKDLGDLAPLVRSLEIKTGRFEATIGSLVMDDRRKEDGSWLAADSGLFGRWQPIRIEAVFGAVTEELFRGYIVKVAPTYPANGGAASLELQLQDDSALLDREHVRQVWGQGEPLSDKTILQTLVSPHGFGVSAESGDGQKSRSLSQDTTPIKFLVERAKANGYELIFSAGEIYFGPPRLEGEPQAPILVYAGKSTNCLSFGVSDEAQKPDKVQFEMAPATEGATPETETLGPDVATLGSSAAADEGGALTAPSVWRMSREGDETLEETRARAQALANENSFKLRANGELDGAIYGHVLRTGKTVTVDGTGARYGGLYYVDTVNHVFSPDGYRQVFELIRNGTGESSSPTSPLSAAASAISSLF